MTVKNPGSAGWFVFFAILSVGFALKGDASGAAIGAGLAVFNFFRINKDL